MPVIGQLSPMKGPHWLQLTPCQFVHPCHSSGVQRFVLYNAVLVFLVIGEVEGGRGRGGYRSSSSGRGNGLTDEQRYGFMVAGIVIGSIGRDEEGAFFVN